jgi:acyl carrier protein
MNTTFERLSAILTKAYKLPPERLTLDAPLEGLGIDSLGAIELLWDVEDAFKIQLPSEPVALATLGDVVRYIDERVAALQSDGASAAPAVEVAPVLRTT